ncbi:MAG: HAMP domain-containing histidine kinase, partial [Chloroflexi bacterium]|nr:HAMP domain-containing histidine kinase [Chloroflexota bacterium]
MVNNILEIRQLQSGAPVILERNNFDLTRLIADIVESIQPLAGEKEICLEYQPGTSPIFLSGDQGKLQRVFTNLISNAVKYTPAEGRVTVTPVVNDHSVTVTVADTGYGIPPEDLPHIFEHFHRVRKHQHRAVGTGLGLAIVKSLVEAHNGTIAVQSEEDKGSSFTIQLPL